MGRYAGTANRSRSRDGQGVHRATSEPLIQPFDRKLPLAPGVQTALKRPRPPESYPLELEGDAGACSFIRACAIEDDVTIGRNVFRMKLDMFRQNVKGSGDAHGIGVDIKPVSEIQNDD